MQERSYLLRALQGIAPHHCPFCESRSDQSYFCQQCEQTIKHNRDCCTICAIPLTDAKSRYCAHCLKSPPPFDQSFAPFIYDTTLAPILKHFKDTGKLACGAQLGDMFVESLLKSAPTLPELIVPVPSHWKTYFKRGFNPAEEIAKIIAEALDVPYSRALTKARATKKQKSMTKRERRLNLLEAFTLKGSNHNTSHIALVDDVVTTGETAGACAKLLKSSGTSKIQIWALARTPDPRHNSNAK